MNEVTLFGNQKVLLEINPLLADGTPDTAAVVEWLIQAQMMAQLQIDSDARSAWFIPVEPQGETVVTILSPEYKTEQIHFVWSPPLRSLNLVINEPVDQ